MAKKSAAKFIEGNRPPRVHIEYETSGNGGQKKVEIPFVMGVMADLSGKSESTVASLDARGFLEIDADNFDKRMEAIKPRLSFTVPNRLSEGNLAVELEFKSMDDFSPAAVVKQVDALNRLLDARTQLEHLLAYIDGKPKAEKLIADLLQDPAKLQALFAASQASEQVLNSAAPQNDPE